jgi:hypothetical protein
MRKTVRNRRLGVVATFAVATLGLIAAALPMQAAHAEGMYAGWDFGNGFGIGVGPVPSASGYHYCGVVATRAPCGW